MLNLPLQVDWALFKTKTCASPCLSLNRLKLSAVILVQTIASAGVNFAYRHPDLIKLESYFDTDLNEVRSTYSCELLKMRANQAFLNEFSVAADRYDAYIRDGLAPWSSLFHKVHHMVDRELAIEH